jgi:secondary thiamine-phosphate synthase enzyme
VPNHLSSATRISPQLLVTAELTVETAGDGFIDITRDAAEFIKRSEAGDGVLLLFLRHTSASLVIQENADPDVRTDLAAALRRIAPEDAGWVHDAEGPDDMPAHVKAMVNGVSLHVPVAASRLALGTWQGIYLAEHRAIPHMRKVVFQFLGSPKGERSADRQR